MLLAHDDPVARASVDAIHRGDIESLHGLLGKHSGLAQARLQRPDGASMALLHVVADWPGYFPNGPATVQTLIAAGADPNARIEGAPHAETPLHWAASSDDVEVAEALIAGRADIEAMGASIAGGTPLDDAVAYGCWRVAHLLVARGAKVAKLWHAAGLGLTERLKAFFAPPSTPTAREINDAFWQACHGGHRRSAEYLLTRGADLNWIPGYAKRTPLEIAASLDTGRESLVGWLRDHGATAGK